MKALPIQTCKTSLTILEDNMDMIEQGITAKAIAVTIGKPLLWLAVVFGFDHAFDFCILQVNQMVILTPFVRELLSEIKIIMGVIISFFVLIKLIIGIKQLLDKKE